MLITFLVFALLMILILVVIITIVIWIKRRKYSRDRFAFVALSTISTFLTMIGFSVFNQETPWTSVIFIISKIFNFKYMPVSPGIVEYLFILLLFIVATQTLLKLYNNWNGPVSVESIKKENRNEPINLPIEGFNELLRIIKKLPRPEIYSPSDTSKLGYALESPNGNLPWHLQARELVMLKSGSYHFDVNNWHDQKSCWLGENKKSKETVVLMCLMNIPSEKNYEEFIEYVNTLLNKYSKTKDEVELLCVIKEDCTYKFYEINNFTIKIECEKSLLDDLVDYTEYINDIKYRVEKEKLSDSVFCMKDIYIASNFKTENNDVIKTDIEQYLNQWLDEPSQKQLALLGEYGQGKSTCTLMFTYHLLFDSSYNKSRFPILLELRGKSPRDMTTIDLLATWAARYNINPNSLMKLLIAGRLLLILEGFDEMALIGNMEMRLNHFRTLWQFCYPNSKILITGRPNFFLDDWEMKAALGVRDSIPGHPFCQALKLEPFSIEQIQNCLRYLKDSVREEITSLAKKDQKFIEIVSRPSLLFIVGLLWERENLSKYSDNINSAFVINLFIKNSYRRQGAKIEDGINFMALNTKEREYFMSGIASFIAFNSLPNQISKDQLHDIVLKLLENIPRSASEMDALSGEVSRPLKERIAEDENAIDHIKTDVRACGLLVADPTKSGSFKFAHKSFMEYLFAEVLATDMTKDYHNEKIVEFNSAIIKSTEVSINRIFEYPGSHSFFAELISNVLQHRKSYTKDKLARKLYELIVLNNPKSLLIKLFYTMGSKQRLYELSIKTYKTKLARFFAIFAGPDFIFVWIYNLYFAFSIWGHSVKSPSEVSNVMNGPFFIILMLPSFFTIFSKSLMTKRRIMFWYKCCKILDINDEFAKNVIGIKPVLYLSSLTESQLTSSSNRPL